MKFSFLSVLVGVVSLLFLMVGADKFLNFLEPPCSLMHEFPTAVWYGLGVLQVVSGIAIWLPRQRRYIAMFWMVFMACFTFFHLANDTYDIGGSASMTVMLGVLIWNPSFLGGQRQ